MLLNILNIKIFVLKKLDSKGLINTDIQIKKYRENETMELEEIYEPSIIKNKINYE